MKAGRKVLAVILALAVGALAAGCGSSSQNKDTVSDPQTGVRNWLENNRDVVQPWIDAASNAPEA